eukprot:gnl/MRDRNA2_/MRDRNA2_132078_c0_seq1.p1 gnl/MRDRNA2_/MRDRNA2_132078_c0~~gnl/MRDRNA2_/MRDRNA2_132078_c0_seq1.p1  ORF type:complete len:300 (+),score=52.70 gnl/MRDRNA2_/MRDRNA2_132078_c0_seq1:101-1000(+)
MKQYMSTLLRFICGLALCVAACAAANVRGKSASRRVAEPFNMDGAFLDRVQREPADIALLFYNPTCPDCEWFMERWKNIGAALQTVPSLVVWTVADPKYAAPAEFDHWHNPDIFFVAAANKSHPVLLSGGHYTGPDKTGSFFGLYLVGDKRPQDEQDIDFENQLIAWFAKQSGKPLHSSAKPDPQSTQAQKDLESLAQKEFGMLMKRWSSQDHVIQPPTPPPAKPRQAQITNAKTGVVPVGSAMPLFDQEADEYAKKYVTSFLKTDHSGKYTEDYLYKYALAYFKRAVYTSVKANKHTR